MAGSMNRERRVAALEQVMCKDVIRWHRLRRNEGETYEQVLSTFERVHGQIGNDNVVLRVIVSTQRAICGDGESANDGG